MSPSRARGTLHWLAPSVAVLALLAGTVPTAQATPANSAAPRVTDQTAVSPIEASARQADSYPQATGERLVGTPTTTPCVEHIVRNYPFKNTAYGPDPNYSGPYDPPAACPGPWARVVATIHVKVTGVQFDRIGDVRLNGTTIFSFSTAEPRGDDTPNVVWTKSVDVTNYTDQLEQHHKIWYEIGNVITGPYDGVYYGSLTLRFYPTDASNPEPPGTPDTVMPVINQGSLSPDTTKLDGSFTLPTDTTSLTADLTIQGHGGCDEFWWADAPPPFPGQCGGPAWREAEIRIDGKLAGIVEPYPYLFTGADGPNWWEPISAPQAMNLHPWELNLTPFVGMLTDGKAHTLSVRMLDWSAGAGDFFAVNCALFSDQDPSGDQVTGALTSSKASKHATILQNVTSTDYQMYASHQLVTRGWYQVGSGPKVNVSVTQQLNATSYQSTATGVHNHDGFVQTVRTAAAPAGQVHGTVDVATTTRNTKLYSLVSRWALQSTEEFSDVVNGDVAFHSLMNDTMTSKRLSGAYLSDDRWRYADTAGACGTTHVAGDNGAITIDRRTPRCDWTPGLPAPRDLAQGAT